jgi:hypothetical protein
MRMASGVALAQVRVAYIDMGKLPYQFAIEPTPAETDAFTTALSKCATKGGASLVLNAHEFDERDAGGRFALAASPGTDLTRCMMYVLSRKAPEAEAVPGGMLAWLDLSKALALTREGTKIPGVAAGGTPADHDTLNQEAPSNSYHDEINNLLQKIGAPFVARLRTLASNAGSTLIVSGIHGYFRGNLADLTSAAARCQDNAASCGATLPGQKMAAFHLDRSCRQSRAFRDLDATPHNAAAEKRLITRLHVILHPAAKSFAEKNNIAWLFDLDESHPEALLVAPELDITDAITRVLDGVVENAKKQEPSEND